MGYIYKITNLVTNKSYIGQTKKTVNYRIKEHFRQAQYEAQGKRKLTHFHASLNKYGRDNFKVETLEKCNDDLLNEREIYWINYYDTYNNGYNSTTGGQALNNSPSKIILQYGLNGQYIQMFESADKAAEAINGNSVSIRQCCNSNSYNKSYGGYQWKYFELNFPMTIESVKGTVGRVGQKILQYDKRGNLLNKFANVSEAAQLSNVSRRSISFACTKEQDSAGGFQWRYEDDKDIPGDLIAKRLSVYCNPIIPIIQSDKKGGFIREWNSIIDAAEELHLDAKKIGQTCEGKQHTYSGFQWQYKI